MRKVVLCGRDTVAGGAIGVEGAHALVVDGLPVALDGDPVAPHPGPGDEMHVGHVLRGNADSLLVNGRRACVEGARATCGHVASASGDMLRVL